MSESINEYLKVPIRLSYITMLIDDYDRDGGSELSMLGLNAIMSWFTDEEKERLTVSPKGPHDSFILSFRSKEDYVYFKNIRDILSL